MIIKKFKKEYLDRVYEIISDAIEDSKKTTKKDRVHLLKKYSKDELIKLPENSDFFVVLYKNKIIGTGRLNKKEFATIYFDKDFRGKGGGSFVVSYLEKLARKKKIERVFVRSLLQSTQFYEKKGFKKIRRLKVPTSAFRMEKDL